MIKKSWSSLLQEAAGLPAGHVKKFEAKAAVKEEYGKCREIEMKWSRRLRRNLPSNRKEWLFVFESVDVAMKLCNDICDMIGSEKIKKIVIFSKEVSAFAAAHYSWKEIHFKGCLYLDTLVHELVHHIERRDCHGKYYCEALEIVWGLVYEYVTGKKCKEDW